MPTGQGLHRLVEGHQQRPEEIVPVEGEEDDRGGDHRRPGQRQPDAPEDQEMPGPIHARRILEVAREFEEELPEDIDGEDIADGGQDQRLIGIGPADLDHAEQQRHDRDLGRDHEGGEEEPEEQIATGKAHAGQRIARHGAGQHAERRADHGDEEAVEAPAQNGIFREDPAVVVEGHMARQPFDIDRHHLARQLEGGGDHPEEGRAPGNGDGKAAEPDRDGADGEAEGPELPIDPADGAHGTGGNRNHSIHHVYCSRISQRCSTVITRIMAKSSMETAEAGPKRWR